MNAKTILKASNIQQLQSLGTYLEVKKILEKELDNKLGAIGWKSFFTKVNTLKKVVPSNKDYLYSLCDGDLFKDSKNKISKLLKVKVKARSWNELKRKIEIFITLFCTNIFDPYDYYDKTKLEKFKNSSRLEGIEIEIPNETVSLENVLAKYQR